MKLYTLTSAYPVVAKVIMAILMGLVTWIGIIKIFVRLERDPDIRPQARRDIAHFLMNLDFRYDFVLVSQNVGNLFNAVFSHSQLSLRCIKNSLLVTVFYFAFFGSLFVFRNYTSLHEQATTTGAITRISIRSEIVQELWNAFPYIFLIAAVGDYLSLGKGRKILNRLHSVNTFRGLIGWVLFDTILSIAIGISIVLIVILVAGYMSVGGVGGAYFKGIWVAFVGGRFRAVYEEITALLLWGGSTSVGTKPADLMWITLFTSTLTASLWTVFIMIGASIVKLGTYLNLPLWIRWFFDIDKYPIRVIGKVMGPLFELVAIAAWLILA